MKNKIKLILYKYYGKLRRKWLKPFNGIINNHEAGTIAQKKIFIFWTGENELTANRKQCINLLNKNSGVEVKLINSQSLHLFEDINFPFHPAYKYLSYNHRSDYLRCYFMHIYGGAYSDIKKNLYQWDDCFDRLNNSNKWILGYPEIAPSGVSSNNKTLRLNYFRLIGNGCFICKPFTPFTEEWFLKVNRLLDKNYEALKSSPGDMWGKNEGYPLRWAEVQGELFHPLIYKFRNYVIHDERMKLSFKDYK